MTESGLKAQLHLAAQDPFSWNQALRSVSDSMGGAVAGLIFRYPIPGSPGIGQVANMAPEFSAAFATEYFDQTPWSVVDAFPEPGVVAPCPIEPGELKTTPFFRHWMRPQKLPALPPIGANLSLDPEDPAYLALYRRRRRGVSLEDELDFVRSLLPLLLDAARAMLEVIRLQEENRELRATLNSVSTPLATLGERGELEWANEATQRLLDPESGLNLKNGRLLPSSKGSRLAFEDAIESLLRTKEVGREESRLIERPDEGTPLVLTLQYCERRRPKATTPFFRVFMNLDTPPLALGARAMSVFGLAPREHELVECLIGGQTVREASKSLGVKEDTVRQYLKRIFPKTGTKNQVELVRLATSVAASMPN